MKPQALWVGIIRHRPWSTYSTCNHVCIKWNSNDSRPNSTGNEQRYKSLTHDIPSYSRITVSFHRMSCKVKAKLLTALRANKCSGADAIFGHMTSSSPPSKHFTSSRWIWAQLRWHAKRLCIPTNESVFGSIISRWTAEGTASWSGTCSEKVDMSVSRDNIKILDSYEYFKAQIRAKMSFYD